MKRKSKTRLNEMERKIGRLWNEIETVRSEMLSEFSPKRRRI